MLNEDIFILKKAFCEFFIRLLPSIVDPKLKVRSQWHKFRDVLLDEVTSPIDLLDFVKNLSFSSKNLDFEDSIHRRTKTNENLTTNDHIKIPLLINGNAIVQPSLKPPSQIKILYALDPQLEQEVQKHQMIIKKQGQRGLSADDDSLIQEGSKKMEKINALDLRERQKQTGLPSKFRFSATAKENILASVEDAMEIMRKHGKTLGCVYDRSFEINTSEIQEIDRKHQGANYNFGTYAHEQQKPAQQKLDRQKSLKGISVYQKK